MGNRATRRRFYPNTGAPFILLAAFLVRLWVASQSFLNEDEALHFMAANQPSWKLTYQASLTISHPPLLIFLLHLWRMLGTTEIVLRLPSVIAGTVFCWFLYKWLSDLFGNGTGLIGLIFASFLPPLIALSAEIRQYALLLVFAMCFLYLLESALTENSAGKMLAADACLWLAILSQYSAVLFAAALGIYAVWRISKQRSSRLLIAVWAAGQAVALLLCAQLYRFYISAIGRPALHSWMDIYLHNSYFDPARHHVLSFIFARTVSLFQYVFGQNAVGDVMFLCFVVGLVFLFRAKPLGAISSRQLALLLILPFAINCAAAFADLYPYGGTRHCVFLAPFAIAGVSFGVHRLLGQRTWLAVAIALLIATACNIFPSHRLPYMPPSEQRKFHMQEAMAFIHGHIPQNELLFADSQTSLLLGHYLCRQQPFFVNVWKLGFQTISCDGYRVAAADGNVFFFRATNFFPAWDEMVRAYDLKPGDKVWVIQAGWLWEDNLARQLELQYPQFRDLKTYSFGHNITMFELPVGPAMPSVKNGQISLLRWQP